LGNTYQDRGIIQISLGEDSKEINTPVEKIMFTNLLMFRIMEATSQRERNQFMEILWKLES